MATQKKSASPLIPLLLILVSLALLATGAWLLLAHFGVLGSKNASKQHEFTMQVGEQKTLEVPFTNSFSCTSSENGIVSFDAATGLLSANNAGQATVVAKDDVTGDSELYLVTVVGSGSVSVPVENTTKATEATTTQSSGTTESTLPPGSVTGISLSFYQAEVCVGSVHPYAMVVMQPKDATDKSEKWTSEDESIATVDKNGNITGVMEGTTIIRVTSVNNPLVFADIAVTVKPAETTTSNTTTTGGDTTNTVTVSTTTDANGNSSGVTSKGFPIEVKDGITYVDGVLIANKTYSLPSTYNPGLLSETQTAFNEMQAAAARDGLSLIIASGFRSYERQKTLYTNYSNRDGKAAADRYSARPGHSEHQSGLGIDINCSDTSFDNTPEAKWLAENCWKYGFIIRYPKGKESITGYMYESWHVRYLGKDLAKKVYDSGLTLEEYYGITSAYQN